MTPQRWARLEELFHAAMELPPEERAAFTDRECDDDRDLRKQLEGLLREEEAGERIGSTVRHAAGMAAGAKAARIGAYETIRELGRGGMGIVYLARRADDAFQKQVAIKLVRRGIDTELARERFRRERQILARLEHPYIARLLDGGTTGEGLPFFVMEFIDGEAIGKYAEAHALSVAGRIRLFRRVCEAVQYAHQNLVIHRDLKPTNILVTADGTPKLLDFGIARLIAEDEKETQPALTVPSGQRFFTPEYASPEQVRGEPVGTAADIYGLGAVLYDLLAGGPPFHLESRSAAAAEELICTKDPPKPSARNGELVRQLRGDLDNIILKALRKLPEQRYRSASELSDDLGRYLDGHTVVARDYTLAELASKFVRRHRLGVAAAGIAVTGLLGGTVVATRQAMEAHRQRAAAEQQRQRAEGSARAAEASAAQARASLLRAEEEGRRAEAGKSEAETQRQAALTQQGKAERHAAQVQELASKLIHDVDTSIATLPGGAEIRRALLSAVQNSLDELIRDGGPVPLVEWQLAWAYQRLGDVLVSGGTASAGDSQGAMASYQRAEQIWSRLLAAKPHDPELRSALATNEPRIGLLLLRKGQTGEALQRGRRGVELAQAVADENAGDAEYRLRLAKAWAQLAGLMSNAPEQPETLEAARNARTMYESVLAAKAGDYESRDLLCSAITIEGRARLHLQQFPAALQLFDQAVAMREALLREQPANVVQKRRLLLVHGYAGDLLGLPGRKNMGDPAGALRHYRETVRVAESILESDPGSGQAHYDVALGHGRLAGLLMEQKEYPQALQSFQAVSGTLEKLLEAQPDDIRVRGNYASSVMQLGDCQRAMQDLAAARASWRKVLEIAGDRSNLTIELISAESHFRLAETGQANTAAEAVMAQSMIQRLALRTPGNPAVRDRVARTAAQMDAVARKALTGERAAAWRAGFEVYQRACEAWQKAAVAGQDGKSAQAEMERLLPDLAGIVK